MAIIDAVTHFGDLVVLLPLAMAAMLWFAYIGDRRLALFWALSLVTCLLITIILKVHFLACPSIAFDLHSPSGHTSLSMLVYGALGTIAAKAVEGRGRFAVIAATACLIAAIAVSRFLLGAHTVVEIATGLAIGGIALSPFAYAYRQARTVKLAPAHFLAILAVLPFALMMESPGTEKIFSTAASSLRQVAPICDEPAAAPGELAQ